MIWILPLSELKSMCCSWPFDTYTPRIHERTKLMLPVAKYITKYIATAATQVQPYKSVNLPCETVIHCFSGDCMLDVGGNANPSKPLQF